MSKFIKYVGLAVILLLIILSFSVTINQSDIEVDKEVESVFKDKHISANSIDLSEDLKEGVGFDDLFLLSSLVEVNIDTNGDVYAISDRVDIEKRVNGDAYLAVGELEVTSEAYIEKDLYALAGEIIIKGTVNGDVSVIAGSVVVENAAVNGSLNIKADKVSITNGSIIGGVTNVEAREVVTEGSLFNGGYNYTEIEKKSVLHDITEWVVSVLIIFILSMLLLRFAQRFTSPVVENSMSNIKKSIFGILILIVSMAVLFLLGVIIITAIPSLYSIATIFFLILILLAFLLIVAGFIALLIFPIIMGRLVTFVNDDYIKLFIGVVLTTILFTIPVISFLAFLFLLYIVGAMVREVVKKLL